MNIGEMKKADEVITMDMIIFDGVAACLPTAIFTGTVQARNFLIIACVDSEPRLKRGLPPVNLLMIRRVTGCQVKVSSDLSDENPFENDVSPSSPRPIPGGNLLDDIFNKRSIAACALLSSSAAKAFLI